MVITTRQPRAGPGRLMQPGQAGAPAVPLPPGQVCLPHPGRSPSGRRVPTGQLPGPPQPPLGGGTRDQSTHDPAFSSSGMTEPHVYLRCKLKGGRAPGCVPGDAASPASEPSAPEAGSPCGALTEAVGGWSCPPQDSRGQTPVCLELPAIWTSWLLCPTTDAALPPRLSQATSESSARPEATSGN